MKHQARALVVIRLSRVTDATTSPERQLEACRELCSQRGYNIVGMAEDLDVSAGSTSPFDRPQLGEWLTNRHNEFDVLVFFRVDRVVRRLFDLADLIRWGQEHSVSLVSATESHFDLSNKLGNVIALLVASIAEMELEAISERNRSAAQYNLRAGKYRGGIPPWGYRPDDSTGEWRYVQDPEQVQVIQEVARRVLEGEPLRAVAHNLTERKILTTKDRFAEIQGREVKGYEWYPSPLKRSLTSPTLLGYAVANGEIIRNDDGSPVVRAEPILTREVFDRLSVELAGRENRKEPTRRSSALLLRVIYCGVCGKPAYKLKGGKGRQDRYRCASAQYKSTCGNGTVTITDADESLTESVLGLLGNSERQERVWDTGSDHSVELAELDAVLADLTSLLGTSVYRAGTPQRAQLDSQIAGYAARHDELSKLTVRPAGWTWQPTGQVFSDWWEQQEIEGKNIWLREMEIRLTFDKSAGAVVVWHTDLGDLKRFEEQLKFGKSARKAVRQLTKA
ncbi:recombinase family protein [Mycobacteroides saopaulense]|uniref:Recombinase family protein n=1 Tax=Mycobacteroides saopaulense TaxID=1578165 RepID=A0A1X0IMG3_9MYCO|nr:recombinase family protein [Mycobacteroides saopaulense]ORB49409.1 recombinase family protein [Mycobacteroides saopaulense]